MAKQFLVPIDLNRLELLNPVMQNLATAPSTPPEGMFYYDTDDNAPFFWDGGNWISMSAASATVDWGEDGDIANVTKAAESGGVLNEAARADHKHDVDTATAATVTTANAEGSATSLARSDHAHAHEAAHINHDTTWAAKGDLIAATANDTAAVLTVGANDTILMADSGQATGLKWVASQTPGTETFGQSAAEGTADTYARGDHAHGVPAHNDAAHSTVELNDLAAPDGDVAFGGFKITGLGTPTADTDGATKLYVDSISAGIAWKETVRAASTAPVTLATAFENGDVIDGVTLATNDRILIKDQAAGEVNGIYIVQASGSPVRATDADSAADILQAAVFVQEGTVNADTAWVLTTNAPITLGTTPLVFTQFSGLGQITAGAGLTKTANTLDVIAGVGIEVAADAVAVERDNANGRVPLLFAQSVGDTSATSFNVDHNLATLDVLVNVYRVSDGVEVECDITRSTTNRVIAAFAVAPTSNQYRVVVHG